MRYFVADIRTRGTDNTPYNDNLSLHDPSVGYFTLFSMVFHAIGSSCNLQSKTKTTVSNYLVWTQDRCVIILLWYCLQHAHNT